MEPINFDVQIIHTEEERYCIFVFYLGVWHTFKTFIGHKYIKRFIIGLHKYKNLEWVKDDSSLTGYYRSDNITVKS